MFIFLQKNLLFARKKLKKKGGVVAQLCALISN
jgi:hypothetical protein